MNPLLQPWQTLEKPFFIDLPGQVKDNQEQHRLHAARRHISIHGSGRKKDPGLSGAKKI